MLSLYILYYCFFIFVFATVGCCDHVSRIEAATSVLPDKLLIAYANWQECDDKIMEAARNGANVIIWFSINLLASKITGMPEVVGGPDYNCVANITYQLREVYKLPVVSMIAVGGWNSPHPSTSNSAEEVYLNWKKWNTETIARPDLGFYGFDGIDWDLEGNDDLNNTNNVFTMKCLDLIGKFSQMAKIDGFLVSMAPCESYIDPTQPNFDRYVNHTYPEWDTLVPNFYYHGHNTYTYILDKYGRASPSATADATADSEVDTFDWISMQLYEGYSHAEYNITILNQSATDYLSKYVQRLISGWTITPADHNIDHAAESLHQIENNIINTDNNCSHSYFMKVPLEKLVIGLGNGWTANPLGKFLFLSRDDIHNAYMELSRLNILPKGFMYWDIADEGMLVGNEPYYMSVILNEVMHTRPIPEL